MNTKFEKSENTTDEWYTPKEIIDALGVFDLDPCAPIEPLYQTAIGMYNKNHDGLSRNWYGRVWLNPPYSRPLIEQFITKMAEHNNGIALLFNRCDSKMFQDVIFPKATAMKAISVKQPWAYLLCAGIKGIENRSWKLPDKYKGKM